MTPRPAPRPPRPPLVVGLIGGIASGKSTVAAHFAARGFEHIDADAVAREVVRDAAILARLRARFGAAIVDPAGALDRAALAAVAFRDSTARADLEAITHPAIRARIDARFAAAAAAGRPVLLDAPLLLEGGLIDRCDEVVFLDTPEVRRRAFARERGWDDDELTRREAAQAPLAVKRARATATIHNDGPLSETLANVDLLLARWSTRRAPD